MASPDDCSPPPSPLPPHPAMHPLHYHYDFAAHPHLPLPLDTPLPPSAFDFAAHGAFNTLQQPLSGPSGHPLFEGVLAMHQMLGHDLNLDWSDMSSCSQPYPQQTAHAYTQPWPSPPPSTTESVPSPLEESPPHTPERILPEYAPDAFVTTQDAPSVASQPPLSSSQSLPPPPRINTTFPLVVTSANTYERTVAFQTDRTKSEKTSVRLDPHAADFLREKLGDLHWSIFSSRLAERRMTTQKPKPKPDDGRPKVQGTTAVESFPADKHGGATVVDFLVKVEIVKSVLRTYVPHPYNPLKTLSHAYAPAPSGQVTLSRSTILTLSGWSNTQFSYWARRAEAISVLAAHDDRLRTAAAALERRLRRLGLAETSDQHQSSATNMNAALDSSVESEAEEWARMYVTGKGLDVIIDEVKKRTGVSPFIRGKHSSLDPFGTVSGLGLDDVLGGSRAPVYMPTFQAEKYVHEIPGAESQSAQTSETKKSGKRKAMSPAPTPPPPLVRSNSGESAVSWPDAWAAEEVLRFTVPLHSRTQMSPPPAYSAEDPNAGFIASQPQAFDMSSTAALQYDFSAPLPMPSDPSPLPKKRRLAPAPPSLTSSATFTAPYAAEALRMYQQQQHHLHSSL